MSNQLQQTSEKGSRFNKLPSRNITLFFASSFFAQFAILSLFLIQATIAHAGKTSNEECAEHFKSQFEIVTGSSSRLQLSEQNETLRALLEKKNGRQSLSVLLKKKKPVAFGTEAAIKTTKHNIGDHADFVLQTTGAKSFNGETFEFNEQKVEINIVSSLVGSSLRTDFYGDLDLEAVLLSKYEKFTMDDLHSADSAAIKSSASFLKKYAKKMESEGYIFSDFKAGEYEEGSAQIANSKTKSRAIKWSFEELTNGRKLVKTANGEDRILTLEEALTSESRIKIDWLVKMKTPESVFKKTNLKERYVETSILFSLGGQRGENNPILRSALETRIPERGATGAHLAIKGLGTTPPLRATSVLFTEKDLNLAHKLSAVTSLPDVSYLNALSVMSMKTYRDSGDLVKVLKRASSRLYFWDDVARFNQISGLPPVTESELYEAIQQIISPASEIGILSQYKNSAVNLLRLQELHINVADEIAELRAAIGANEKNLPNDFMEFEKYIEKKNQEIAVKELDKNPAVARYIEFVLQGEQMLFADAKGTERFFVSFVPDSEFIGSYRKMVDPLREKFPNLNFSAPDDLHMTISFAGQMSKSTKAEFQKVFIKYRELMEQHPFSFNGAHLELLGGKSNQLALVFSQDQIPAELKKLLLQMKSELNALGTVVDPYATTFLPHITIASSSQTAQAKLELQRILSGGADLSSLENLQMDSKIHVMSTRPPATRPATEKPDAQTSRFNTLDERDLAAEDFLREED